MAKRFRLKKWYPSLHKSWDEGAIVKKYWKGYRPAGSSYFVSEYEVENNPEFWEPVEKKDYEILGHDFTKESEPCSHKAECPCGYPIYKVKRLSDGEVFTVGDKITHKQHTCIGIIENFIIEKDGSMGVNIDGDSFYFAFNNIQHIEEPLFVTEDGVDIYEGDDYWYVDSNFRIHFYEHAQKNYGTNPRFKYFSTEEKALEWIDRNKPRYSRKDITEALSRIEIHKTINTTHVLFHKFWEYLNDTSRN